MISLCIAVRGQLHETKGIWGLLASTFIGEKVYVASALPDRPEEFFLRKLLGRRLKYLPAKNRTLIEQLNLLWLTATEEILIFVHNDVYLYEDWQKQVEREFLDKRVGFICALGVRGTTENGGRIDIVNNMIEAELHGRRSLVPMFVSHGDGFFLAFRRKALEKASGFDTRYKRFHGYDRDICLSILEVGYLGRYVPISCHHRSGLTACSPEYQEWVNKIRGVKEGGDKLDHDENMYKIFNEKWKTKLPVLVDGTTGEFIEDGGWGSKKWK